jgi:hypothetical protein
MPFKLVAQFAKIVDSDGYVNMREKADSKSRVVKKIKSGNIVYISTKGSESSNWSYVTFESQKEEVFSKYSAGYIHNSRLRQISDYLLIPSVGADAQGAKFTCCGIEVEIKSENFDYQSNKNYFKKHEGYFTYKGKFALGCYGLFPPKSSYQSVQGFVGKRPFKVYKGLIENLFDINNEAAECYYDKKAEILYIILNNSDGSGSYNALLVVKEGNCEVFTNDDN